MGGWVAGWVDGWMDDWVNGKNQQLLRANCGISAIASPIVDWKGPRKDLSWWISEEDNVYELAKGEIQMTKNIWKAI